MPDEDKKNDKKKWGIAALCVILIALAAFAILKEMPPRIVSTAASQGPGYPGGGGRRQRPPGTGGQITSVSAQAITVQPRGAGAPKSFALTAATKITRDRKPATASDLKAGLRGFVVSKDGKTADEVHLRTGAGRGGPGAGRGGPGGPPG